MQRVIPKSAILYLLWLGLFIMALIILPSYLGSLIAKNQWQVLQLLIVGFGIITLFFSEIRYTIICATASFILCAVYYEPVAAAAFTLRWVFLITLATMAIAHWMLGRVQRYLRMIDFWALAFLALAFYSETYSIFPSLTRERSIATAFFYLSVFWGVWIYVVGDPTRIRIILQDFVSFSFVIFLLGFFLLGKGRFSGVFVNPNAVGAYAAILVPIALWSYLCSRRRLALFLLLLTGIALVLSQSRAGMVSTLLGSGYFFMFYQRRYRKTVMLGLLFLIGCLFLYSELFGSSLIEQYFRFETISTGSGRLEAWKEVMRLIRVRPWFGYGFGTEDQLFQRFDIVFQEHSGAYAHNSYIGLVSQLGLVGACIFYVPLFLFFFLRTFQLNGMASGEGLWLEAAIQGSILGGLVNVFFESWLYSVGSSYTFSFWMFVVLSYYLSRQRHQENR
ncbi:MAG: O-antigen ligase family protein [Candidatus Omnitrophica bacterium]|nr:O-antigen ligase family protein [Candidatus Omnitrophota bacterium]